MAMDFEKTAFNLISVQHEYMNEKRKLTHAKDQVSQVETVISMSHFGYHNYIWRFYRVVEIQCDSDRDAYAYLTLQTRRLV